MHPSQYYDWDTDKNTRLVQERGVSFNEVVVAIESGQILDIAPHPNPKKYPNQRILIVRIGDYAYSVPFVEESERIFFKTIYPSRKATKKYRSQLTPLL